MKHILPLLLLTAILLTACVVPEPTVPTTGAAATQSTNPAATAPQPTEPIPPTVPIAPTVPVQPTDPETKPAAPAEQPAACPLHQIDPYVGVDKERFYESYSTACCYADACYRTAHFLMSGSLEVPEAAPTVSAYQPMDEEGRLIRNTGSYYMNEGNTYVVVDAYGQEVMRIYKGAAYITLEEVAAYMYAFGGSSDCLPANYVSQKLNNVGTSPWGIYLRGNHSYFIGDTRKYPYEPELPDISGCGGKLRYYEMDIGTTGTDTGNGYVARPYNDGSRVTRGAARLVYTRMDKDKDGIIERDEVFVFYTYNHYNDFQEYLNYYGGWGEMFGNITGGGTLSSKTHYNPTPYIPTAYDAFCRTENQA